MSASRDMAAGIARKKAARPRSLIRDPRLDPTRALGKRYLNVEEWKPAGQGYGYRWSDKTGNTTGSSETKTGPITPTNPKRYYKQGKKQKVSEKKNYSSD